MKKEKTEIDIVEFNTRLIEFRDVIISKWAPVMELLLTSINQFLETFIEFWNSIPDELKKAVAEAEFDTDDPEREWEEDEILECPDCGAVCQDGLCWYCENQPNNQ